MRVRKNNNNVGQEAKTTKLCASVIGICAIPPFNMGYNSHTIQLKLKLK